MLTLIDVIIRVESFEFIFRRKASKGVNNMSAKVRIDVLRSKLGKTGSVNGPI